MSAPQDTISRQAAIDQFRSAIEVAGLTPPDVIEADGKLRRFSSNGEPKDDAGWYVLFDGAIPAGTIGDHRSGVHQNWRADIGRTTTTEEETACRARMEASRKLREREERKRHDEAATKAAALWQSATPALPDHPYLVRKQIAPVGTLREIDATKARSILDYAPWSGQTPLTGRLLVAPIKIGDKFSTCELIDGDGRKTAIRGGKKQSGYWAAQALPEGDGAGLTLLIGEGVATVLTACAACGHAGIAALSSGNLLMVAKAMRNRYPVVRLVLVADLVKATGEADRHAAEAAQAVGGLLIAPDFGGERTEGETDFNDMAVRLGVEAVRSRINAALDIVEARAPAKRNRKSELALRNVTPGDDESDVRELEPYYAVMNGGLYYVGIKRDSESGEMFHTAPLWLCDPLKVLGSGADDTGRQFRLLQWSRQGNGEEIRMAMPSATIGEREGWASLRNRGLAVASETSARNKLAYFLQKEGDAQWHEIVSMTGWQNGVFILPSGEVVGTPKSPMHFIGNPKNPEAYRPSGTLESWRENVGALARDNPLAVVSIACALAGPLLSLIDAKDGIGLHLYTTSSSGKSTTAEAAASVWGHPARTMHTWSGTALGLALASESANDLMLYLDEIGAGDARKIGPAIYQMLNGVSKLQGARDGGTIASRSWRLGLISTGEVGMSQYLAEGGQTPRGGQEIRLLDIPADQGKYKAFDCIHGRADGGVFANDLSAAALAHYGTLGREFVLWLAPRKAEVRAWVADTQARMLKAVPEGAAPTVQRATRKFGVLCAAVEMASAASLTGWTKEEASGWVQVAWTRWLSAFGIHDRDDARLLDQADGVLREHQFSRFASLPLGGMHPTIPNLMGYKRKEADGKFTFLVLPKAFKEEVVGGYEARRACEILHKADMLERPKGRAGWTVNGGKDLGQVYRMTLREDQGRDDG